MFVVSQEIQHSLVYKTFTGKGDLAAIEQIVNSGQLRAIAEALVYAKKNYINDRRSLSALNRLRNLRIR